MGVRFLSSFRGRFCSGIGAGTGAGVEKAAAAMAEGVYAEAKDGARAYSCGGAHAAGSYGALCELVSFPEKWCVALSLAGIEIDPVVSSR